MTSVWRHHPKMVSAGTENRENHEKKYRKSEKYRLVDPSFLYFHEIFQKKIVSLTFNTNKASKSVKNENHNFRIPPTTGPYFRKYRWLWSKNFRKHVKLNFVSLKISPGRIFQNFSNFAFSRSVGNFTPPPNQNRVKVSFILLVLGIFNS